MSKRPGMTSSKLQMEFPNNFFALLERSDTNEALECLRNASITNLGEPSPTAKKLMERGEWDSCDTLQLVLIDTSAGSDGLRFCGKIATLCSTAGHVKNTQSEKTRES
jgi:hypothetical protein